MKITSTYYIKRNGASIWLNHTEMPRPTDQLIDIREVIIADEGKELLLPPPNGEVLGSFYWNAAHTPIDAFTERTITYEEVTNDEHI